MRYTKQFPNTATQENRVHTTLNLLHCVFFDSGRHNNEIKYKTFCHYGNFGNRCDMLLS